MNLRNLIENIKDPTSATNQSRKDKQSNNQRRRDRPQDQHGKQHSQDNKNNSKYNQKKSHSSRSRDDQKHGSGAHKSIQQRGSYKKNSQPMKIPEKKIIDMERIREEHSQTSLQIGKNQSKSLSKTIDKQIGSRISSDSNETLSQNNHHRRSRRYHAEDSNNYIKKSIDIKDRVTRKKNTTSDAAYEAQSEHRITHRRDDQYSDQSDYYNRQQISHRYQKDRRYNRDSYHRDSRQRQSGSGVSSDNNLKEHIKNHKETSDSQMSIREKSSDILKISDNQKRRVEKEEKYISSENATQQIENSQEYIQMRYDEIKANKSAKPDVSLKAFLTRNNDVKYEQNNSRERRLIKGAGHYVKIRTEHDHVVSQKIEIDQNIENNNDGNMKNKFDENQTSNSKILKQSQNTDPPEQQQLMEKPEGALAKPRSESIGYKGHQTNHQFQISDSNDSKVFKIPKSKEHKFSDPMTSSPNHTPVDSKDSQNHSHHSDNVIMDVHEREIDEVEQQLQQEPIILDVNQENITPDQVIIEENYEKPILEEGEIANNNTIEEAQNITIVPETQQNQKKLSLLSESEKEKLNAYIFTINNFISVSKLVLNRFVVYLQFIKDSYMQQIRDNKLELLQILAISKEKFSQKTQVEFIKVIKCMMAGFENVKDFENVLNEGQDQSKYSSSQKRVSPMQNKEMKVNFTSIKHCIKRIQKACQMQIDDFQQKNGIYREEILLGSIQDDQLSEQEYIEFMMNKRMLRERMQLLMDLIEIEQVSKQYLELFRKNFILLYELVKHDVMDIIFDDQINNQIDSGSDFEEHMRTRAYYIKYSNFLQFNQANFDVSNVKNINSSIIDIFTSDELKQISSSTTLLVSLMEIGNTVDSVTIISKILDKKQKFIRINADCFDKFLIWKKRKCHCCMEYILDGGKAVTCVNIIQEQNPCKNIYCQNCVVAYLEQNASLSIIDNEDEKEKNKEQKEKDNKKLKHKLWLKAQQNILFICPCCQGMCLIEDKEKQKNLEFAKFSICNFNHRIINNPKDFLKKQFYWSRLTCNKRKFQLANVIGICKHKNIYKVELLSTSQIYQIKLQKEEIFFTDSVKNGSKLFKIINSEGFELDLKNIIDKQVKDFDNHSTYSILEKYKNYVDKPDQLNNGFIIPKFNYEQVQYRPEFVQETRNLMKRYDNQLFDSFELELQNICHKYNDEEDQNSLFMSQNNQSAQLLQKEFQPMILRQIKETDYRKLNNQGNRVSDDEFEMVDNEPEKHFLIEKSMLKGTAKTPFDKLKIERANIKNTPYELTMEPVNGKRELYDNEDEMMLQHYENDQQIMEQEIVQNDEEVPLDQNIMSLDQGEQWKQKQRHQILNNYQFKENHLADQKYRLSHPNIGAMLVQEKNIQFAKDEMNRNQGDRIQLLVNRQVFRIERIGDQLNNPGYVDAIGELKEMYQKPSETYEGHLVQDPASNVRLTRFEQPLFDVERGASREQIIEDQIDYEYDQNHDQFYEDEDRCPRAYKIRKIGDSAEIVYDFDNKAAIEKNIKRRRSSSNKRELDDKEDRVTESFQKIVSRVDHSKSEERKQGQNEKNEEDEDTSMLDEDNNSRSRSGGRNYLSQKQMDATRLKQENARIQRERLNKEQEMLLSIQEEQRHIRLAKREEIKRINIFNQIQKRKMRAEARKKLKELNGEKSEDEEENEEDEERQVKIDEEIDEIKDKKDDEKSQNTIQQQSQPLPEKKWKKPKVHADKMMQQNFLANQQGRSLMIDRQKSSQEVEKNGAKNQTEFQDYEVNDTNIPTNRQKKEAIKQYSEQQKLFTQQHKASPTKIIKNRMLKEKGDSVNQVDLDYLKALEIGEKKEYNLRAGRQRSPIDLIMPKLFIKPVVTVIKKEENVEPEEQSEIAAVDNKIEPRVTRGQQQVNKSVEEEFYDDFPIEIIKKYNLKISNKRKEEIQQSRRRKTNLKQQNQKPVEDLKVKEKSNGSQKNSEQIEIQSQIKDKEVISDQITQIKAEDNTEMAENKDSSVSEIKQEQSKQPTDKPNYDKLYFRRFIMRPQVEEHHRKLHQIVLTNPQEIIGFYIYIYRKSQNLWRRAFIKNFFPGDESKRMYELVYQNEAKLVKQINLMKVIFMIDYSSESPKNSQDLSKLSKQSNPKSEESNGQNEETRKSIDKLKNYGLFNNKKRVRKMLQKIEEQLEKEESKKDSVKQENDDNSSLSKLSSQKAIINDPADVDDEPSIKNEQQEVSIKEELTIQEHQDDELMAIQEIEEPNSQQQGAEIKQELSEQHDEFAIKRSTSPKDHWIKDMKQKLLSKTRQTSLTQKILKFYHQEIEIDDDFSKSYDQSKDIPLPSAKQDAQKEQKIAVQPQKQSQIQNQSIFPPQNYLKNNHTVSFNMQNNPNDQQTNHAQMTQELQQYELQLQHQQQNYIAQKQVHDSQNEKINNMILQINNQEMMKNSQIKSGEFDSQDFNSARDMVQQKLLLSRLQQKSYLIDEQKQKYKEQIQQLYALDLDKPENKENRKIFEQLTYEFEQYTIMQQFMDQIYQQQIQAYFMRQQLDERSQNRDAASNQDHKSSSKGADSDHKQAQQYGPQIQEIVADPNNNDKNGGNVEKKVLAAQLEQYNQFQQMQIEYASKTASQQMMNQFYNEKNNYLLMNQVLSAEYLLNLKQQYANELLQEDKEQEEYEQQQQQQYQQDGGADGQNSKNAEGIIANLRSEIAVEGDETWDRQYLYLKQIQQLLDRIGNVNEQKEPDQTKNEEVETKNTFDKIEEGIKVLEQTYQEEKYIEQEIFSILNLENNQQPKTVTNLLNQFKSEDTNQIVADQELEENPENVEIKSPKNKQQLIDGSEIKPEFFFEHINYLAELKKKQQATIALNFQMRDNNQDDQESVNASVLNPMELAETSTIQILQEALDRFYQKQIVFNGFKKCKCQSCFKMVNPILIKYDAESNEYLQQHQQQLISFIAQNQNSNDFQKNKTGLEVQLRQLFILKKSDHDIEIAMKQQKEKIQKFDQSQDQQHETASRGGSLGTDKEEYLRKYPCFKLLIKRIIEEEENTQEKQNLESEKKSASDENLASENLLPKLSQIFPDNLKTTPFEFNIDFMEKQFEDQIKMIIDQNPEQKDSSEQNEQDIVSSQVKLDLMRTMQKMLVQFKLLKQLEKPKFDKNFGKVISQGTKIKSLFQKKRQSKENVKLAEKQKRIEMQNYINSLYRNQYLGQRFGDDENKIWDYTTVQAPGAHPYNYMFANEAGPHESVNIKNQPEYAQNQPGIPSGYNYGPHDLYYAQQQSMMQQHMNYQDEIAHGVQSQENPYMYQHLMGANFRGPKHFVNGNQQPVYNINTFANGGNNHMTNYNSNFNNCQIFQPQIINQNYLTTMAPHHHLQHEKIDVQAGPKSTNNDIEESKQHQQKKENKN